MQCLRATLASLLCVSLTAPTPALIAQAPATHSARPAYHAGQIQGDDRIIHALNRFTFGPRPGDLAAVKSTGLEAWFDQQLHPGSIDHSALDARLGDYPAMRLTAEDLLYRLPSNAVIRQSIDGKIAIPDRGVLRAVYQDQAYRVAAKKQEKQAQLASSEAPSMIASGSASADSMNQASSTSPAQPPPGDALAVDQISAILVLAPQPRLARLIALTPAESFTFFQTVKGPDRAALLAGLNPAQRETVLALENPQRAVADELMAQRLVRDIDSPAQLQEVMTDFWLNHFNVFLHKNEATPYYLVDYERDVIRPRALGKFEDLLEATAHSPAMMLYLDNAQSIGPDSPAATRAAMQAARNPDKKRKAPQGLNENYARELMELHTLGVNGGYTQADVTQVARILTGWTVDRPQRGGAFRFDPRRHEPGTKKVLGHKFKENGEREGRDLLHLLATQPATARFLSRKLAIRFVSDNPPQALVDHMAAAYLSSGGDIAVILKTMFHSPEFWSPDTYRAKVKTPLEYIVSAIRAGNAEPVNLQPLITALRDMGMPLYGCVPPTGYKWDASDWISTGALVARMNFALSLAGNRLNGIAVAWSQPPSVPGAAASSPVPTPESEEIRLESALIPEGLTPATRAAVLQQFQQQTSAPAISEATPVVASANPARRPVNVEKQDQLLAGLLLGSPEFQRR